MHGAEGGWGVRPVLASPDPSAVTNRDSRAAGGSGSPHFPPEHPWWQLRGTEDQAFICKSQLCGFRVPLLWACGWRLGQGWGVEVRQGLCPSSKWIPPGLCWGKCREGRSPGQGRATANPA